MRTSDNIDEICKALVGFHSEVGRIAKDGTNPHLKNRYATIDAIMEEIRPALAKHGLFVMQLPTNLDDGSIRLVTRLYHQSGQLMESDPIIVKPQKNDAQGIGSAVTYARRYSLTSFLSLSTGDDDDGHAASAPTTPTPQGNGQGAPRATQGNRQRLASELQIKKIMATVNQVGITDEALKKYMMREYGKRSKKELTTNEASALIKMLEGYQGGGGDQQTAKG
ncbi:ERF family protein [Desmospora activa]|uniref:ERF superfamily protein n=1 Tax=Desmospora activa DSM 45169 TaxID=1121389 RepID=A0A2T4Z8Z2_9BACL|nr:ERF family protein [Desmospora activa]PTM58349.1 ERF superfamily protein [Desmospora activa DSM 45169]